VTFNGALDVGNSVNGAELKVTNGLDLERDGHAGQSDQRKWYGGIGFAGTQTLGGNGTVVFGDNGNGYDALFLVYNGTTLTIGSGITVHGQIGFLGYNGGAWGAAQDISIVNQGIISADGNGGTITINALPFVNSGIVAATVGTMTLSGSVNLTSGTLEFGLSSTSSFGKINISGNFNFGGTVSAILLGDFVPVPTNSFSVLSYGYGSYTGAFANTELPSNIIWQTNYSPTTFTLTVSGVRPVIKPIVNQSEPFLLQFTGSTNNIYTVLASTNLAIPLSNWATLGNASLLSNTLYQFIDTNSTNFPERFYMLRSP
jgi:hypothetical protein